MYSKWRIHIEKEGEIYIIVSTFGLANEGSKQQVHTRIIEKGKGNRNPLQQANLEAESKWNEKKQRDTYSEILPNIDIGITNNMIMPIVRPILANLFDKELYTTINNSRGFKLSFPVFTQKKIDGIRCMSHVMAFLV